MTERERPPGRGGAPALVALALGSIVVGSVTYRLATDIGASEIVSRELGGRSQTLPAPTGTTAAVWWDFVFIAGYGLALWLATKLARWVFWTRRASRFATFSQGAVVVTVLADVVENVLLLLELDRGRGRHRPGCSMQPRPRPSSSSVRCFRRLCVRWPASRRRSAAPSGGPSSRFPRRIASACPRPWRGSRTRPTRTRLLRSGRTSMWRPRSQRSTRADQHRWAWRAGAKPLRCPTVRSTVPTGLRSRVSASPAEVSGRPAWRRGAAEPPPRVVQRRLPRLGLGRWLHGRCPPEPSLLHDERGLGRRAGRGLGADKAGRGDSLGPPPARPHGAGRGGDQRGRFRLRDGSLRPLVPDPPRRVGRPARDLAAEPGLPARGQGRRLGAAAAPRHPRDVVPAARALQPPPLEERLLHVTDGGHYENLGLVELLHADAASSTASTPEATAHPPAKGLAQALTLAEAELGVKVTLDHAFDAEPGIGAKLKPEDTLAALNAGLVAEPVITGTITYPAASGLDPARRTGILVVARALLWPEASYPLLSYATQNPVFPRDSTGDQWFNDGQFCAYTQLGRELGGSSPERAREAVQRKQS